MGRLGEALTRDWELKLASLLIACAVWAVVFSRQPGHVAVAARVEYVGLGRDVLVLGSAPPRVDVEVQTTRWAAARLGPDDVRVRVNLAEVPLGENVIAVGPDEVQTPPGVRVTRVSPAYLRVALSRTVVRRLPVRAQISGQPAPGYVLAGVGLEPETLQVRGPQSTIEARRALETEPVDVTGRQSDVMRKVEIVVPDSLELVKERQVQVTVAITKRGKAR